MHKRTRPCDVGALGARDLPPAALEEEAELLQLPAAALVVTVRGGEGL